MKAATEKITGLILDTIPEAVAWKNPDSVYLGCNLKFAISAGCRTTNEIIGKTDRDLPWKKHANDYLSTEKQVLASGIPRLNLIEFYHHADSDDIWLDVSLLPIKDPNDRTIGLLIVFRDISEDMEIKQALHDATTNLEHQVAERTQELYLARQEAIDASEEKSRFLSSMSHELRTPLNAILGFAQLLQMDHEKANGAPSDDVNEIYKAGQYLLNLINEVLDLAKIEAGRLTLSLEPVDIRTILKECLDLAAPLARQYGIKLVDPPNVVEDCKINEINAFVVADFLRLKQILLNLISNAIKYNNKGGSVTVIFHDTGPDTARIVIVDTGRGIDVRQQAKLFSAFERLGADQEEIEGTGIGLVLTKRLIEEMQGQIGFDSAPGKGSQFWIELPKASPAPNPIYHVSEKSVLTALIESKTVLYIEDNPANLRMLSKAFENWRHWALITASESESGLEKARNQQPDLILLDLNLPVMDGYSLLEKLKQSKRTNRIPVFAVSANAMPADIEKGMRVGFSDYITKPIDLDLLYDSIRRLFA